MTVCNACRYCEGYCAVFPAMEKHRRFDVRALDYLANLCHGCRSCYYACQYAPPHVFELNPPKALADVRLQTYQTHAWPRFLGRAYMNNGMATAAVTFLSVLAAMIASVWAIPAAVLFASHTGAGAFYKVVSYNAMVYPAGLIFLFAVAALGAGFIRYWRAITGGYRPPIRPAVWFAAMRSVATMRHLGNNGHGCSYPDVAFSNTRRVLHQFVMYGFFLCFAATCVATVYDHVFGWIAPYGYLSLPVSLGTTGGVGITIGGIGLLWIKFIADRAPAAADQIGMDVAFIFLLLATALSGLALLAARETAAMGMLLVIHLGFVLAFFLLMPYGKFAHGVYRFAALLKDAADKHKEECAD